MFSRLTGGGAPPKDTVTEQLVERATNENLTSVDWAATFALTDAVCTSPFTAKACADSLAVRLQHRNPNVVLQAVNVIDACYKNCGEKFHIEVVQPTTGLLFVLSRMFTLPGVNESVRLRIASVLLGWTTFEPLVAAVVQEVDSLRRKGYAFPAQAADAQATKSKQSAADKLKEDEEIQLALAISLSETEARARPAASRASTAVKTKEITKPPEPAPVARPSSAAPSLCRVVAAYDFVGREAGELAFKRGDTIDVIEKNHQDWWKGRLDGAVGVFPANYVKEAPAQSPVSAEVKPVPLEKPAVPAGEQLADLEAQLQTDKISLLHQLLSSVDPSRVNVADDDTIQELVAACTALKPRLVEVICEYEKKRDELVAINADFAKARASYDKMLAAALTRKPMPAPTTYAAAGSGHPAPAQQQVQQPVAYPPVSPGGQYSQGSTYGAPVQQQQQRPAPFVQPTSSYAQPLASYGPVSTPPVQQQQQQQQQQGIYPLVNSSQPSHATAPLQQQPGSNWQGGPRYDEGWQAQPSGGPYVSPGAPANYSADGQAQYSQQPSGYTQSPPSGSAQDDLLMIDFS